MNPSMDIHRCLMSKDDELQEYDATLPLSIEHFIAKLENTESDQTKVYLCSELDVNKLIESESNTSEEQLIYILSIISEYRSDLYTYLNNDFIELLVTLICSGANNEQGESNKYPLILFSNLAEQNSALLKYIPQISQHIPIDNASLLFSHSIQHKMMPDYLICMLSLILDSGSELAISIALNTCAFFIYQDEWVFSDDEEEGSEENQRKTEIGKAYIFKEIAKNAPEIMRFDSDHIVMSFLECINAMEAEMYSSIENLDEYLFSILTQRRHFLSYCLEIIMNAKKYWLMIGPQTLDFVLNIILPNAYDLEEEQNSESVNLSYFEKRSIFLFLITFFDSSIDHSYYTLIARLMIDVFEDTFYRDLALKWVSVLIAIDPSLVELFDETTIDIISDLCNSDSDITSKSALFLLDMIS